MYGKAKAMPADLERAACNPALAQAEQVTPPNFFFHPEQIRAIGGNAQPVGASPGCRPSAVRQPIRPGPYPRSSAHAGSGMVVYFHVCCFGRQRQCPPHERIRSDTLINSLLARSRNPFRPTGIMKRKRNCLHLPPCFQDENACEEMIAESNGSGENDEEGPLRPVREQSISLADAYSKSPAEHLRCRIQAVTSERTLSGRLAQRDLGARHCRHH